MPDDHDQVYVLRLWREPGPAHGRRISVYDASSGQRHYFCTLDEVLDYLRLCLDTYPSSPDSSHLKS